MSNGSVPAGLSGVKHIIMVLSGKGGVGKSTVSCQLAFTLAHVYGHRVGLLDVDLCGPSVAKICGVEGQDVFRNPSGWVPVAVPCRCRDAPAPDSTAAGSLSVMSIAFLLGSANDAVVWRGPKKDTMIKQFVNEVNWGELDYLVIDTPPGTSDEHLTLCEVLKEHNPTGAVVVTTPQDVSADDVRKELSFCHKLGIRCLGIVENMSGFVCPHCAECTAIFSKGGGKKLAAMYDVPFLGEMPIDPSLSLAEDSGESILTLAAEGGSGAAFRIVVENIRAQVTRVMALSQEAAPAVQ